MSLLIVSASLNPESNSRLLAREAARVLRGQGQTVTFLDLRDLPLPFCDGDKAYGHPNVSEANRLLAAAAGIIIATPIYNYDASATIKNFVELTGKAWENKVVGFLCTAGGHGSFMSIMSLANSLMLDFRCIVVPRFVYATGAAFSPDATSITDEKLIARTADLARATAKLAIALASLS